MELSIHNYSKTKNLNTESFTPSVPSVIDKKNVHQIQIHGPDSSQDRNNKYKSIRLSVCLSFRLRVCQLMSPFIHSTVLRSSWAWLWVLSLRCRWRTSSWAWWLRRPAKPASRRKTRRRCLPGIPTSWDPASKESGGDGWGWGKKEKNERWMEEEEDEVTILAYCRWIVDWGWDS